MTNEELDRQLTAAVEHYVDNWPTTRSDPEMTLTDVLVVVVRRGFDESGGKSQTITLTPTDSSIPILMGMARYAGIRFEKIAYESFHSEED